MEDLPGVDLAALGGWLDAARPGLRRGALTGEVIAGGKSNLTYRITDGAQRPGRCAARRWRTCCRPRTTWPASSG